MITSAQTLNTFNPSRGRYLFFKVLVMFASYQLAFALYQTFFPKSASQIGSPATWLVYSLAFTAVYSLSLYIQSRNIIPDLRIHLIGGNIEGPSGKARLRTRFPLANLDKARTQSTNFLNVIFQYRHIWSTDGKRIVLYTNAFDQAQVAALFEKLGC